MPFGSPLLLLALAASAPPPPGSLDKEVIRGIIRSHVGDVQRCYQAELVKTPDLFGKIMVKFTIAASGDVSESAVESSTTRNLPVETCTAAAVRRWRFPKPEGGGIVIVSYPFVLTPGRAVPIPSTAETGPIEVTVLGLQAIVHTTTNAEGIPSNGLIAMTERGLLLVDTAWTDAQTEALLAWGEARLGRPWIGAVITHDHADRDGGLGALQRRHIPVAALDLTVAKLAKRGVRGVDALFTARDGVFKDPRGFEAFYPGPGHASDNIVLSFPGALYGGCLVKSAVANDLGFTGDADLAHWADAVRRVAERYQAGEARRPRPRPGRRDRRSAPAHVGPAGLPAEEVNGHRACRRIQSGSVIAGWARRKRSTTSASVSGSTEAKRRARQRHAWRQYSR